MACLLGVQRSFEKAEVALLEVAGWGLDDNTIRQLCHATAARARSTRERRDTAEAFAESPLAFKRFVHDLHALLAAAYDADGKFPDAVNEYERAIKMSPYEEGNYCDLANAYLRHRQFKAAIDVFPTEPLHVDHPIRRAEGVVLSAHRAGSVREGLWHIGEMVVDDLEAIARGCGFLKTATVADLDQFREVFTEAMADDDAWAIFVRIAPGESPHRPSKNCILLRDRFKTSLEPGPRDFLGTGPTPTSRVSAVINQMSAGAPG